MTLRFIGKFIFVSFVAVSFSIPVLAGDGKSEGGAECSNSDLRAIKGYNALARKKIKDYNELVASTKDIISDKDAEKFSKEMDRITNFFSSDKTKDMEETYKRCDMTMPRPMAKQSFWIPEDQRIDYSGI